MLGPDKGDSSRQRTVEEARSRGVSAHLEVQDSIPKMLVPQLLDTGDIFLNTSCIDNTPVSVLEAMASGLCIVSTDAGGIPYLLQSGKNALLVPLDDDREMAAAVRRLLTDHALSEQIQHASRATVCAFDWSVILPQWQVLLTSVAERHACMRRSRGAQLLPPAVL
jgi:glycosyltransferase involved in cell wall biosynthesis